MTDDTPQAGTGGTGQPAAPTAEELKHALKAFRKRLKVTRLDHESKLGRSPLTSGSLAKIAIQPPHGHRAEVWAELVRQGKLRERGSLYELVE